MRNGRVTLKLTNRLNAPRVVVLEPWTGEYTLEPGETFEIVAEGELECPLEVEVVEDRLVVYSFDSAGALLTIFKDGKEIPRSEQWTSDRLNSPALAAGLWASRGPSRSRCARLCALGADDRLGPWDPPLPLQ
jgi:hypothetical protein